MSEVSKRLEEDRRRCEELEQRARAALVKVLPHLVNLRLWAARLGDEAAGSITDKPDNPYTLRADLCVQHLRRDLDLVDEELRAIREALPGR